MVFACSVQSVPKLFADFAWGVIFLHAPYCPDLSYLLTLSGIFFPLSLHIQTWLKIIFTCSHTFQTVFGWHVCMCVSLKKRRRWLKIGLLDL
jgi:hypothetical protein